MLDKEIATHSSILAWEIPWTRGAWRATVHGEQKSWTRLSGYRTAMTPIRETLKLLTFGSYLFRFFHALC